MKNKELQFKHISVHNTPEQSPGFLLWRVSTLWRRSIEAALKPLGLTHPQFVVLACLGWLTKNGERVTQVAVGNMASLDPNTMSQVLKGLELKKLIKRIQSSDIRAKNPLLTTKGSHLLREALPIVEKADAEFFAKLTTQESNDMLNIFQKLTI